MSSESNAPRPFRYDAEVDPGESRHVQYERGSTASRMARLTGDHSVSDRHVGLDFHTSTRNRTAVFHGRADMDDEGRPSVSSPTTSGRRNTWSRHPSPAGTPARPGGTPPVHLVETAREDRDHVRRSCEDVGLARHGTFHWMGKLGDRMAESVFEDRQVE